MQRRLVRLPSGDEAWVQLSDFDELKAIRQLPTAWAELVRRRFGGATVDQLWRMQSKLSREQFNEALWVAFGFVDRQLWFMAEARARQIVTERRLRRGTGGVLL